MNSQKPEQKRPGQDLPRAHLARTQPLRPSSQISSLQNLENNFLWLKPLHLLFIYYFFMAAQANQCNNYVLQGWLNIRKTLLPIVSQKQLSTKNSYPFSHAPTSPNSYRLIIATESGSLRTGHTGTLTTLLMMPSILNLVNFYKTAGTPRAFLIYHFCDPISTYSLNVHCACQNLWSIISKILSLHSELFTQLFFFNLTISN
jgi:hypothetical protein